MWVQTEQIKITERGRRGGGEEINKGMQLIEMLICTSAGHHFSTYSAALQVALAMQRMQIKVGCWHIPLTATNHHSVNNGNCQGTLVQSITKMS